MPWPPNAYLTLVVHIAVQIAVLAALAMLNPAAAGAAEASKAKQIAIVYEQPKNPAHQHIYEALRNAKLLEKVQEILSPFRLPRQLTIILQGCDGSPDVWYAGSSITACYEYFQDIWDNAPKETTPAGITRADAIAAQSIEVFFHEFAHALFDMHQIPVLGAEEDAADRVSAILMLSISKEDARRAIGGAAYLYREHLLKKKIEFQLLEFAGDHSTPQQRFYDLICLAYGSNREMFADVVEKGYLPKGRAEGCEQEFRSAMHAFNVLIGPHIDQTLADQVLGRRWLPEVVERPVPRPKAARSPPRDSKQ